MITLSQPSLSTFQVKAQSFVRPVDNIWKRPTWEITIASDTEYRQCANHPNKMITTQLALSENPEDCIVLEHPKLGLGILPTWQGQCIFSTLLGYPEVSRPSSPANYLIVETLMFFAPADLLRGCFRDHKVCRTIQKHCRQDARIRVETTDKKHRNLLQLPIYLDTPNGVCQLVLKVADLGKLSVGGLKDNCLAFGLPFDDKELMDKYKRDMLVPYMNPELLPLFIKYGKFDSNILFSLRKKARERMELLFGIHGLEVPKREILTTGSLVAALLQAYIQKLVADHPAYELFKWTDSKGNTRLWTLEDMLNQATVARFAKKEDSRKQTLALVQGGMAKNYLPHIISLSEPLADADIASAYVSLQRLLTYPVGIPRTFGNHRSNDRKTTLGRLLRDIGSELVPRLWFFVVSGSLNHQQLLVPSKLIDSLKVSEKYDEDDPKIPANLRLYTQEIKNGVITSDVLDVLKNVCTPLEYAEWMNLEVEAGAWYPKEFQCATPEEWYAKTQAWAEDTGNAVVETKDERGCSIVRDLRSPYWFGFPLNDFLKPYAELRAKYKNEMKDAKEQEITVLEEFEKEVLKQLIGGLDAKQNSMKLVGNTNYGVLASPYFPVSNVILGNVITAGARVYLFCMAAATGGIQGITDGLTYLLNAVRDWTGKKPSMNTLSCWGRPHLLSRDVKKGLITRPLGSDSLWTLEDAPEKGKSRLYNGSGLCYVRAEGKWEEIDRSLEGHLQHFFRGDHPIDLLSQLKIEHKDMYVKGMFHGQTNYLLTKADGSSKLKARGNKVKGTPYNDETERARIYDLFEALDNDPTRVPPFKPQTRTQVLKCNQANEMENSSKSNVYQENELVAGDSIEVRSHLRPISLSAFLWQDDEQYQAWSKDHDKLKAKTGYGLEHFFLNDDGTLNYEKALLAIQTAIDHGKHWIVPKVKGYKAPTAIHPYLTTNVVDEEDLEDDED